MIGNLVPESKREALMRPACCPNARAVHTFGQARCTVLNAQCHWRWLALLLHDNQCFMPSRRGTLMHQGVRPITMSVAIGARGGPAF
jgi:hypothetical protein